MYWAFVSLKFGKITVLIISVEKFL